MGASMSPQEEETLVLAAIARLGEATAHDIATELGVATIRHTLQRLEHARRVVKRRLTRAHGEVWVFRHPPGGNGHCEACGRHKQVYGAKHCADCHRLAQLHRASVSA